MHEVLLVFFVKPIVSVRDPQMLMQALLVQSDKYVKNLLEKKSMDDYVVTLNI